MSPSRVQTVVLSERKKFFIFSGASEVQRHGGEAVLFKRSEATMIAGTVLSIPS